MSALLPEDLDLVPDKDETTEDFTARLAKRDAEDIQFFADLWRDLAAVLRVDSTVKWKFSNAHRRIVKLALAQMWKRVGGRVEGEKARAALKARLLSEAIQAAPLKKK